MHENREVYNSAAVVQRYRGRDAIHPAEAAILERLGQELSGARMLDIGVGAGRTTLHFAPAVREYVGVDYAPGMVAACRERFKDTPNVRFEVVDARDMAAFADASFDFVLFSYMGIDAVGHEDRARILTEVRRVLRPGGRFVFSAHNLRVIPRLYHPYKTRSLITTLWTAWRAVRVRMHNPPQKQLLAGDHALIRDGVEKFRVQMYYIKPEAQVRALQDLGFRLLDTYGLNGRVIGEGELVGVREPWVHYLCER
jgi:ubiquinone/menaquinone biosynthesis C-methylase UbiE